jgi:hypothetical protein
VATERLSILPDGRVAYQLRHRWRNGATRVIFEPLDLIAKLAALVPPPRFNLVRYHGIFGPASRWRSQIVPFDSGETGCIHRPAGKSGKRKKGRDEEGERTMNNGHPRNYSWSELMLRVFELDVLKCPACGGRMRILCAIYSAISIPHCSKITYGNSRTVYITHLIGSRGGEPIRKAAAYSAYRLKPRETSILLEGGGPYCRSLTNSRSNRAFT